MNKTKLSVNINKIATLRNARGKNTPDLLHIARIVLQSPAHGLTVHPRPDERHIRYQDVLDLKDLLKKYPDKEFNIEGYPSSKFLNLVKKVQAQQCTLVPDPPEALTSNAGWDFVKNKNFLKEVVSELQSQNIRVSLFLDPLTKDEEQDLALQDIKPDRIELYTEHYAENWNSPQQNHILSLYKQSLVSAEKSNIKVNAGHDLNQKNLFDFLKFLPAIQEVSIGQALIAEALEEGLNQTINNYLKLIDKAFST